MIKFKFKKKGNDYKIKLKIGNKKIFKSIVNITEIIKKFLP